jgi:glucosylceramidase
MNSCDFSIKSYNFDNVDGDFDLDHFDSSVTHDVATGMVRMILEADAIARTEWNSDLGMRILVSPWSPPPWMKQSLESETSAHSETMTGSAYPTCIRDGVGPKSDYAKAWAKYFGKFITACEYLYIYLGMFYYGVTHFRRSYFHFYFR